jgi:hypothetical protein
MPALDLLPLLERWDSGLDHRAMRITLDSVTRLDTNATNISYQYQPPFLRVCLKCCSVSVPDVSRATLIGYAE